MCSYMSGILITIILIARLSVSPPLINYATMHTGKRMGGCGGAKGEKPGQEKYGISGHSDLLGFF